MSLALPGARRALASTLALGAFAFAGSACARGYVPPPSSPSLDASAPRYLGAVVNNVRADYGRGSLQMAYDASAKAQALAQSMADQGRIFHSSDLAAGIAPGWTALAENVASASTVAEAQQALENSPGHMTNMLGPYNQLGIGIATNGNGVVFVAEEFVAR